MCLHLRLKGLDERPGGEAIKQATGLLLLPLLALLLLPLLLLGPLAPYHSC